MQQSIWQRTIMQGVGTGNEDVSGGLESPPDGLVEYGVLLAG